MNTFWKVEHDGEQAIAAADRALFADALGRHVRHAGFVSVEIHIGSRSQAYIAGCACPGCRQGRCVPGCRAELLRRVLAAGGLRMALQPLQHALARRPYRRFAIAVPAPLSQPLGNDIVAVWPEARLQVRWRMRKKRLAAGALLAVSGDGPPPADALRAAGWRSFAVPRWLGRILTANPAAMWCGRAGELQPYVCAGMARAPGMAVEELNNATPQELSFLGDSDFEQAYATLVAAEQPAQSHAEIAEILAAACASPPTTVDNLPWPAGPLGMSPAQVAAIVERMLATPAIVEGRPMRVGLAVSRVARAVAISPREARALLVWFDQAGLVEPTLNPAQPWAMPRPLVSCDPAVLSSRLQACTPPDEQQVRAIFDRAAPCNP